MNSGCNKEDTHAKKKYVFFSDPDVIVQRAEASAAAVQVNQDSEFQQQQNFISKEISKEKSSNVPVLQFDLKDFDASLPEHLVHPYPFTFISAVKRKIAVDSNLEVYKKTQNPTNKNTVESCAIELQSNSVQNLHEIVRKMEFIRPLKVPDMKISAKKISARDNSISKELISPKFEAPSKDLVHERMEKPQKSFERVQRRLDFSASDVSSIAASEIEPLKVPNISISSNLSKKKDYVRENSREKENRSKRIRKDDSLFSKQDEGGQDFFKRSRSPRHVSRKDFSDDINESMSVTKLKNDRLPFHMPRESDFVPTKPKTKNFATSTVKKDSDKKHRSVNARSSKSRDTSLESKGRTCSNESLSERSSKLPDRITVREPRNTFENFDYRYKDDLHALKQTDDQKHMFSLESRHIRQHKTMYHSQGKVGNIPFKEQSKRISEKVKPSTSKGESKIYVMSSKEFEDIENITDSNTSIRTRSPNTVSTQQLKNKDSEKPVQSINIIKSSKTTEDSNYTDNSSQHENNATRCTNANMKKREESFTQSIATTTKQTSNSNESNLNDSILLDALLDPRRISFRDENQSQQEEFCDLVTPDMNLVPRSKRKRQFMQNNTAEADSKCLKYNTVKTEPEQENIPLLHPTALHMQFQAELHLLDSFNESLRQVMDVEKCLYNVKQDQEKEFPLQHSQSSDQVKLHFAKVANERNSEDLEHCNEISKLHKHIVEKVHHTTSQTVKNEFDNINKINKPVVKAVEVQTQTVNDIATQTEIRSTRRNIQSRCSEIHGISYERGFAGDSEVPQLSLDSAEQFEDLDQIEEISLPSKLRTMSEISLHETTSSIRTETGTEISISTRDVTCSFNKYLDLEIAQLIKDEKQRYDKIEMLFKSREKTLNDRTKKLVKLEEQKRALRDTGQDSRVSSVKKKQRALLLKLQQEKDEMNRLKELHKIASQERKVMLQKQRNMFNPQMSTKNILTKLKRSADSQSPRRLSGPMKGYDIRSNSSMSSLVDSDKSQHDRSQTDSRMQMSGNELHFSKLDLPASNKFANFVDEPNAFFLRFDKSTEAIQSNISPEKCCYKQQKDGNKSKYEMKPRKFEEKMPRADILRMKSHQHSIDPKSVLSHSTSISEKYPFEKEKSPIVSELLQQNSNKSVSELAKSESDTLVEELSKKSKPSQITDSHFQNIVSLSKATAITSEIVPEGISSVSQETIPKTSKSSQVSEDILQTHSKSSKRSTKSVPTDMSKKTQYSSESKSNIKRRSSKCQKSKSSSSILTENILRSKSNSQMSEDFTKYYNKRTKMEKDFAQPDRNDENAALDAIDHNESQNSLEAIAKHSKPARDKNFKLLSERIDNYESKENMLCQKMLEKKSEDDENSLHAQDKNPHNLDNMSTKSQTSNFAVSHHSSGESDRNYSKSVVIRSQDHSLKTSKKLEQILNAREAALTSRKNCVEEWMTWHAKLRAEEDRVARMEQAALKLVTATSNVFSHQERSVCPFIDTTVSSDTSDIEGRIELLTEKLAERRIEMSRLKREARKQTKQKLRALEANLLNQIKKYDTTIHEMRKKLESKKGTTKDSDKLAIESRSLADFKVPEIPLKKIQDIFKNSDLLRSRSESDLLSTKRPTKDLMKSINILRSENTEIQYDKYNSEKVAKSSRSIRTLEHLSSGKTGTVNSVQSVLDEYISEQIESEKLGSMSPVSDDVPSEKNFPYDHKIYGDQIQSGQSTSEGKTTSISEDIKTETSVPKSETNIPTQSETKLSKNETSIQTSLKEYKSDFDTFSEQSQIKSTSLQSGTVKLQDSELSHTPSKRSKAESFHTEINTEPTNEILDFSRKLDFLRLNNKNLNEDISSLENELKILSEMMSRITKKSNNQSKHELQNDEKSTSKDISEVLLKSDNNEIDDVKITKEDKNEDIKSSQKECGSDISQYLTNGTKLKSANNFNDNRSIVEDVDNVMSVILPPDETSLSRSNQEIDYKARSKEILNEIEKSIISEHIKATENDLNSSNILTENNKSSAYERNEEISNSTSIKTYTKSLSEIYSKSMQDEKSISTVESASEAIYLSKEANVQESLVDTHSLENQKLLEPNNDCVTSLEKIGVFDNNIISQELPYSIVKQATVVEYVTELLKKEIFPRSKSLSEEIEDFEKSIDRAKNEKYQTVSDTCSDPKMNDFELKTSEHPDNKNESNLIVQEEVKSIGILKGDAFDQAASLIRKDDVKDESQSRALSMERTSFDKDNWTTSDSFDIQQDVANSEWERSRGQNSESCNDDSNKFLDTKDISHSVNDSKSQDLDENVATDIEDLSLFIPKGESTNIDVYGIRLDETQILERHIERTNDKIDDILDIMVKDTDKEQDHEETVATIETDEFQKAIYESVTKILDKVEKSIDNSSVKEKVESQSEVKEDKEMKIVDEESTSISNSFNLQDKLRKASRKELDESKENVCLDANIEKNINVTFVKDDTESVVDISLHVEIKDDEETYQSEVKSRDIVITELEPGSLEDDILSELEVDAKVELAEEEIVETTEPGGKTEVPVNLIQEEKPFGPMSEEGSSDGEQLDNLVEVTESGLDTIEKQAEHSIDSITKSELISHDKANIQVEEIPENELERLENKTIFKAADNHEIPENLELIVPSIPGDGVNKVVVLKDPEYEDISEESLEVSEIFDKSEHQKSVTVPKSSYVPERYEAMQESVEVLRILDEITQRSTTPDYSEDQSQNDKDISEHNEKPQVEVSDKNDIHSVTEDQLGEDHIKKEQSSPISLDNQTSKTIVTEEENPSVQIMLSSNEEEKEKLEQDASSESSEGRDTPKGVPEIEMDSPRDADDSRLDIDTLNDDLLNNATVENQNLDPKNAYHAIPIVATSEKDIEVMIDKLKASLEQPGLEVAEFEAKLLRIEQLQIELEIKKLEAEEVSYYVREIPNKPPPPYTPPGGGRRASTSLGSPSPPPVVIPSNIEELTAFTEKATAIIFRAKEAGDDIMSLEAPSEIYELTKENDETVKKDRRIYNTFLFDLCKETIAEIYQAEYEKPGPSWTKPNVKTKPTMKLPKTIEELNEYVNKEVATLFGFKTKLQRENMVMRWSRKRRDRVDELLAREAQAEEDEWTKFHHDELAVKNGLTVAILDTLIMETVNVVKVAYAKKRKVMV